MHTSSPYRFYVSSNLALKEVLDQSKVGVDRCFHTIFTETVRHRRLHSCGSKLSNLYQDIEARIYTVYSAEVMRELQDKGELQYLPLSASSCQLSSGDKRAGKEIYRFGD